MRAFLDEQLKGDTTSMARVQQALRGSAEIEWFSPPAQASAKLRISPNLHQDSPASAPGSRP